MQANIDAETLAGFVDEVRGYLPELHTAANQLDFETAHRLVHTIRGAAAAVGRDDVRSLMDQLGPDGHLDPDRLRTTLLTLELSLDAPPVDDLDDLFAQFEKPADPPTAENGEAIAPELLEVFALEAEDHLRILAELLPQLEQRSSDRELVQQVRRSAHTLKGSAAVVGFSRLATLAHRMEDLLDLIHEGRLTASAEIVALLLASTDALAALASGRSDTETLEALDVTYAELLASVPHDTPVPRPEVQPDLDTTAAGDRFLRVPVERLDDVTRLVGEMVVTRAGFEQRLAALTRQSVELADSVERLKRVAARLESRFEAAELGGRDRWSAAPLNLTAHGFDDLELDHYTEFHLLSRQLAETAGDLLTVSGEMSRQLGDCDGLLRRQGRLTSEAQDRLTKLRMVPLGTLTARLERTVRSVARDLNKEAELVVEGDATDIDKALLDQLADPLLHLLRNAVDHGLESPDERERIGKTRCGSVTLRARRDGGHVVLSVADDGRGIDVERVRASAVTKGLVGEDEAKALTIAELHELLFRPGFSTAREVTEVSGRGVGLDVVRDHVRRLEGSLDVISEVGRGTTFTLRLPLTVSLARAVLVRAHGETWAVPLEAVRVIVRLDPEAVRRQGERESVRVGGESLPLLRLGRSLNLKQPSEEGMRPPVLVLQGGSHKAAVVVDQVLGAKEVVVKDLGPHLKRVPGVSGATLTGDGRVVLILDPAALLRPAPKTVRRPAPAVRSRPLRVMVVDDSPSVRRVATGMIAGRGWTASSARDGLEAVEMLEGSTELPDVILLDVEMPRMDGYELLAALRAEPRYRMIPVVMVTSRSGEKHRRKAMDLGASGYAVKPFEEKELLGLAERLATGPRPATTPA